MRVDQPGENDLVGGIQDAFCAISGGEIAGGAHVDDSIARHRQSGVFTNAVMRVDDEAVGDEEVALSHGGRRSFGP